MKKPARIVTYANFDISNFKEHPDPVSLTVPDMSLSLPELVLRYTRGQYVSTYDAKYDDDFELPDFSKMDTMDKIEYLKELDDSLADYTLRMKEKMDKAKAVSKVIQAEEKKLTVEGESKSET